MAKYKYNGEILPALPNYDTKAYPFAVITADYCLYVLNKPLIVYDAAGSASCVDSTTASGFKYYNSHDETWGSPVAVQITNKGDVRDYIERPIWSNHNITDVSDGVKTYLEASAPVPVDAPPTDDGETGENNENGNTGGGEDTGDTEPDPIPPTDATPVLAELYIKKGGKLYQIGGTPGSYTAISITSFGNNAGTKEYGEVVNDVLLSWSLNKTAKTLTLDGVSLDVSSTSLTLSGLSITHDSIQTWTLEATDNKGATAKKTTAIAFANGIYFGASAEPSEYNSAFVLGLTKRLQNSKMSPFTVNAETDQYIYYALPKRLGACEFTVGVLTGGFALVATIEFQNAHGYTEDYYIYRSDNANLGSTTVSVA